jgi:hypothetical protein
MDNFQVIGCFSMAMIASFIPPHFPHFYGGLAAGLGFGWAHFRVMCWALGTGDGERG